MIDSLIFATFIGLPLWFVWSWLNGQLARYKGLGGWEWVAASIFFSPLLIWAHLLAMPDRHSRAYLKRIAEALDPPSAIGPDPGSHP